MVRALSAQDGDSARALVQSAYGGTRHLMRALELLESALTGNDPECLGLACTAGDGRLDGVLLYGIIGGAAGVIKVHELVGAVEALAPLIGGVRRVTSARDARMFICELSNAVEHLLASKALASHGFSCEARIADYFADGISLEVLALRVDA